MNFDFNSKQIFASLALGFLVMTGTYNAIVINSESSISGSDYRLAKRIDEIYGTTGYNREVAAAKGWQKLKPSSVAVTKLKLPSAVNYTKTAVTESSPSVASSQAAVKDDLSLNLSAVINPKKWPQGINNAQFNGSLTTNQGVIESLSVTLPNEEGLSISFSEMNGNVFEYDFEGELYSGMMYQEGPLSYVVSLTNGPLEGTRLTFTGEPSVEMQLQKEENDRILAERNDSMAGEATETPAPVSAPAAAVAEVEPDRDLLLQNDAAQAQPVQDIYVQEQGQQEQPMPDQAQLMNSDQSQAAM